jgi:hypothetical protein
MFYIARVQTRLRKSRSTLPYRGVKTHMPYIFIISILLTVNSFAYPKVNLQDTSYNYNLFLGQWIGLNFSVDSFPALLDDVPFTFKVVSSDTDITVSSNQNNTLFQFRNSN